MFSGCITFWLGVGIVFVGLHLESGQIWFACSIYCFASLYLFGRPGVVRKHRLKFLSSEIQRVC